MAKTTPPWHIFKVHPTESSSIDTQFLRLLPGSWHLAEAFKQAGDAAAGKGIDEGALGDVLLFPVAYLYRHAIELALKHLIFESCQLLEKEVPKAAREKHDLQLLWEILRPNLLQIWPEGNPSELESVDILVNEFDELDKSGQEFRYSEKKDGNRTLDNLPRHVNFEPIVDAMHKVFEFLNGVDAGISAFIDMRNDAYSDFM